MTYEFECPVCHEVLVEQVPMGTKEISCSMCAITIGMTTPRGAKPEPVPMARRILSATPTTFRFADRRD